MTDKDSHEGHKPPRLEAAAEAAARRFKKLSLLLPGLLMLGRAAGPCWPGVYAIAAVVVLPSAFGVVGRGATVMSSGDTLVTSAGGDASLLSSPLICSFGMNHGSATSTVIGKAASTKHGSLNFQSSCDGRSWKTPPTRGPREQPIVEAIFTPTMALAERSLNLAPIMMMLAVSANAPHKPLSE